MFGVQFTKEEEQYLIDNYGKLSAQQIAEKLGRGRQSIMHSARKLGLQKPYSKQGDDSQPEAPAALPCFVTNKNYHPVLGISYTY